MKMKKPKNKIKLLDDSVANLIAAGEVVERPASVVKELVENAIDAQAQNITVSIEEAGMKKIQITDDGEGMTPEDAKLAFSRHATSKIKQAIDLETIGTFGFRGEALPSVASVSRIEIKTRTRDQETGLFIKMEAGKVISEKPIACNVGTDLIIRDLFFNTPARKQFMKSNHTEQAHAIQAVEMAALANRAIRFQLIVDQRKVFNCASTARIQERLYAIYGKSLPQELLDIENEAGGLWLRGCIGGVGEHKNTRQSMRLFINQRPVEHRGIAHAVIQAYKTLIPDGRFPVAFLFFEMPGHLVDVNVHPAKREVRLRDEKAMHHFVYQTIQECLKSGDLSGGRALDLMHGNAYVEKAPSMETSSLKLGWSANTVRESVATYHQRNDPASASVPTFRGATQDVVNVPETEQDPAELRIIGQVGKTYIAAQDEIGFLLVDQHAAHERLLFESYLVQQEEHTPRQSLLLPLTFECSAAQATLLESHFDFFDQMGFEISCFGKRTYTLQTQPTYLTKVDLIQLVKEMLDSILETGKKVTQVMLREKALHQIACKAAVKAGDRMQHEAMLALVTQALALPGLPTCPHGRPFMFRLKWEELDKLFKRDYS